MPNWSDARWKNQIFRFPLFLTPYLLMVPCHEKVMALLSALSTGNKHVRDIYINYISIFQHTPAKCQDNVLSPANPV